MSSLPEICQTGESVCDKYDKSLMGEQPLKLLRKQTLLFSLEAEKLSLKEMAPIVEPPLNCLEFTDPDKHKYNAIIYRHVIMTIIYSDNIVNLQL